MKLNVNLFRLGCFLITTVSWAANIDWPTVGLTPVASGLAVPTAIAHAGDGSGRLFVTEKIGRIRIIQGTNLLAEPFLTITDRVLEGSQTPEPGLLGLAFPTNFQSQRQFYVNYTRVPDLATVVSRFRVSTTNDNLADPDSEQVLLIIPQPYQKHKGGCLAFGPDGYLYIATGNGGPSSSGETDPQDPAQKPQSLLGKILRVDVSGNTNGYAIPTTNPFLTNNTFRPEIWARGLRNPWRFSFDRFTGDCYISDVGPTVGEEINFQPASSPGGENYGWNLALTGVFRVQAGVDYFSLTYPIWNWGTPTIPYPLEAVIGGYVYRGTNFPRMQGFYIFSDWGIGGLWGLKFDGTQWQSATFIHTNWGFPSTFGEDDQGELYIANLTGGAILRVVDTGECSPPVFAWTNTAYAADVPVACLSAQARIHYTTENRDPTETDPWIQTGASIAVTPPQTIRARSYQNNLAPSAVAEMTYATRQVAAPTFNPIFTLSSNVLFQLACATPGAQIFYTTNGATPDTNSFAFTQPIPASPGLSFSARAYQAGFSNSVVSQSKIAYPPYVTIINGAMRVNMRTDDSNQYWLMFSSDLKKWLVRSTTRAIDGTASFSYSTFVTNQPDFRFFRIVPVDANLLFKTP